MPGILLLIDRIYWNSVLLRYPENLAASARALDTTVKQVISRHGKDKKSYEMYKNEKRSCKACKTTVFALNMQI